ncbi:AzlC family ABC transporter permease [Fuchsiella alkaliacetigena]|uniref:AzlC family ABC transporter permease n=1 Tax=Fuchsiella alkaliacetigena TaxID=957042 RepID=UPI00200B726C|nr:AzlC family ABC transporter permease [Fuchsiella alkaliacetigena]MCK8823805.1 AzlC family ABC transporter permease [Fuchsiella alkaliacetigena]
MEFRKDFLSGLKKGSSIALGYLPIAITFGLIANSKGVPNQISILMSLLVFAGASQFIAINLLSLSTAYWQIVVTTFIVNLRHLLMTASIAQKIKNKVPKKWLPLLAFGITDETFSLISLSPKTSLSTAFILGVNIIAYTAWITGTAIGVYIGSSLPKIIQASMGIALYAMFIGLLLPSLKESRQVLIISALAIAISSLLYWGTSSLATISQGWQIIITTVLASTIGALIFTEEVSSNE